MIFVLNMTKRNFSLYFVLILSFLPSVLSFAHHSNLAKVFALPTRRPQYGVIGGRKSLWEDVRTFDLHRKDNSIMMPSTSLMYSIGGIDTSISTLSMDSSNPIMAMALPLLTMGKDEAELLAGPLFGISLFPYLIFLYFLQVPENDFPKGVTVGFATCLLFVALTIPAAIVAKIWYGLSLADSDWLHGSAESLLTITNLVTVVAFRQALRSKQQQQKQSKILPGSISVPLSVTSYGPMVQLVKLLTLVALMTAVVPALLGPESHTPYLNGFLDLTQDYWTGWGAHLEPDNALTIGTWIIHISSLVEFLVAMGFVWRWSDVVQNPTWKSLTWGLIPLHTSGIIACTSHLFYNHIPILVPLQALMTCVGNTTAAFAAFRVAISNGWTITNTPWPFLESWLVSTDAASFSLDQKETNDRISSKESSSLVGFEDLGDALENDNDFSFLAKLFVGCAVASYVVKYGELFFDFPFEADADLALLIIVIPTILNAFKWWKRSQDPTFEGWF
jgi:Protein of unknown function (DUF3593)/Protein of unknown function (DUF2499)